MSFLLCCSTAEKPKRMTARCTKCSVFFVVATVTVASILLVVYTSRVTTTVNVSPNPAPAPIPRLLKVKALLSEP